MGEKKEERRETVADIVAEMRASPLTWLSPEGIPQMSQDNEALAKFADRIEAAVTRKLIERDKVSFHCGDCAKFGFDCDAGDVDGNEDCIACENFVRGDHLRDAAKMVGNAAALRQALEKLLIHFMCDATLLNDRFTPLFAIINHALAAPPRNCDRFANIPGDAICAWLKEDPATRYMTNEEQNAAAVFARWLFDVAAQEGGKA